MAASCCRPQNCHGCCWLIPLHLLLAALVPRAGAGDVDSIAGATSWPAPQASMGRRMPIVHQHSQYSPQADKNGKVSHMEILSMDQRRVENINRRVSETSGGRVKLKHGVSSAVQQQQLLLQSSSSSDTIPASSPSPLPSPDNSTILPALSGSELKTGSYVMAIGLGTPSEQLTVELDTGSNMAWVQCKPCIESCDPQGEPFFSPANSSTYANIPCASPNCSKCSRAGQCLYDIYYWDGSLSEGYYSHDTLILGNDTIRDFRFGCSSRKILGGWAAGVMGLGRGKNSLTMQAYNKYKGVFAYCLPADATGSGFLQFGPGAASAAANARLTPMLTYLGPTFYYVALTGIKVGGHLLPIQGSVFSARPTLVDSGTVITRLPPAAYSQLRSAFAADMGVLGYNKAPSFSFFDTCFNLTGLQGIIPVPTVSLVFQGNATLDVDSSGILYAVDVSHACLAFVANDKYSATIIGSTQQKTYSVLYDIGNKVVGFAPGAC